MGSATREALASSKLALEALPESALTLSTGEDLFAAGRIIGESAQFRGLLGDPSTEPSEKRALISAVFANRLGADALSLLTAITTAHWSTPDELLAGIEEIALRVIATTAPADVSIEAELFSFGAAVSSDAGLELAIGSSLGTPQAKVSLINALLEGKASEQTAVIVRHLVQQPRGRRIAELLGNAANIVADASNQSIAFVTSASPIAPAQLDRLRSALGRSYGRELKINQIVDPSVLGGLRVQIGDDVIDGSIEARLNDLRQKLAG
ncbi:F0F1 ATP synthase subunit delta [Subtercola boreus]|uniref:ATP synthase subunit delta n=1 Tax=Subtercola boreus TaxID=120213 RepID=A0A3E0WBB7_9MICO|nr:F0F1 ATP synthase subunit delta [Subtercola boreus]RFA20276.1 F0F1 ATP synthase subunit delta [Subtercola boreus]RFA20428.1 F0F1 ATP synthase subunit delta [Subtercola boreus]RFA26680.1 F0F1 ATP synthase subunit delta [Subtercola boreus]